LKNLNIKFRLALIVIIMISFSVCKTDSLQIDGNWQGEIIIEMSHDHEEYQTWDERIEDSEGNVEIVEHIEHINWDFINKIILKFGFDLATPIFNSQIEGSGTGEQSVSFSAPNQCSFINATAENFNVSVFGSVQSTAFDLKIVPKTIPNIKIDIGCNNNVRVVLPDYKTCITDILSNLNLTIPIGDIVSTGGSGTIGIGGSISPLTYIYTLKLNRN